MQPLPTTRRWLTWLCMCPADEATPRWQRALYIAHTVAFLLLTVANGSANYTYFWKNFSTDFIGALFGFMIGVSQSGLLYFMVAAILLRYQIESIFTSLSNIYKSNKEEASFEYVVRANDRSEWMWPIYMKYSAFTIFGQIFTATISVIYCYLIEGQFNYDHSYRPVRPVYPWNQRTPAGYVAEVGINLPMLHVFMTLHGLSLLFFVSLCFHHRAFYQMFKHKIEESVKCDFELLCHLIRFHLTAKNFFMESANVYRSFILIELICNTITMTISIFFIDLQSHQFDFILTSVLITTSVGMSHLLFYCYFGKVATDCYELMSNCVYEMDWYEQPNELQKHFILMIENTQKPLYYHGFEVATLNLNTFIKFCRSIISYYFAMKSLSSK